MVLDTSAVIAILAGEPERARFVALLAGAADPLISAATLLECSIVMLARTGPAGVKDLDALLAAAGVRCVAVDQPQTVLAREAFARFGKGRAPAALNFGDCFAYALANAAGEPLLFKGEDFSKTDIQPAAT
ncbi:MAG TPA: type II toxin-antitoxin system VapC family toxin [Solirubrobacteraceae bacterium]|nr:type II toxin-antitoxin system VapC family toxin [Solirubrobacteraceae bacterium]